MKRKMVGKKGSCRRGVDELWETTGMDDRNNWHDGDKVTTIGMSDSQRNVITQGREPYARTNVREKPVCNRYFVCIMCIYSVDKKLYYY